MPGDDKVKNFIESRGAKGRKEKLAGIAKAISNTSESKRKAFVEGFLGKRKK